MNRAFLFAVAFVALAPLATPSAQAPTAPVLLPTNHPRVPAELTEYWMAPDRKGARTAAQADLASAVKLAGESNYAAALPILSRPTTQQGPLGDYAAYYKGLAELRLDRPADARRTFQELAAGMPVGYLLEAASLLEAESAEALGDAAAAEAIYERLSITKTVAPHDVLMRLGRVAKGVGDTEKAANAFSRVYFEFPFSDLAALASAELDALPNRPALTAGSTRYKLELGRAERLFTARSYAQARAAFENLRKVAQGDDRELIALRLAESDYFLKRVRAAREAVRPYVEKGSRRGEALFFFAIAERDLGSRDQYIKSIRRLVDEFADQTWAEEGLNNLASYYIIQDEDDTADRTLREMFAKFPKGRYAERAAWKIGWLAYRNGQYADTVRVFEDGAANFPRSDYRPAWLYWSARAYDALKQTDRAQARYALLAADYENTYYGRIGAPRLSAQQRRAVSDLRVLAQAPPPAPVPPNEQVVRALLGLELYDQALQELRYAQLAWGDSSPIQATMGWIYHQQGEVRAGINAVKRAYPQYMTSNGERLPAELLKVIYPLDYWQQIRRYAAEHQLDPYMMAALILQESNFDPAVRSSANAYGLMQLIPATGRRYNTKLKLTQRFSTGLLTTADANLRMGTAYFADLMKQFGSAHYALASYNAGEGRVVRWMAERPGLPRDEFIDDIPFAETANYVKRILGTMEDYRRLYGTDAANEAHGGTDAVHAVADTSTLPAVKKASAPVMKKPLVKKSVAKKPAAKKPVAQAKKAPAKTTPTAQKKTN